MIVNILRKLKYNFFIYINQSLLLAIVLFLPSCGSGCIAPQDDGSWTAGDVTNIYTINTNIVENKNSLNLTGDDVGISQLIQGSTEEDAKSNLWVSPVVKIQTTQNTSGILDQLASLLKSSDGTSTSTNSMSGMILSTGDVFQLAIDQKSEITLTGAIAKTTIRVKPIEVEGGGGIEYSATNRQLEFNPITAGIIPPKYSNFKVKPGTQIAINISDPSNLSTFETPVFQTFNSQNDINTATTDLASSITNKINNNTGMWPMVASVGGSGYIPLKYGNGILMQIIPRNTTNAQVDPTLYSNPELWACNTGPGGSYRIHQEGDGAYATDSDSLAGTWANWIWLSGYNFYNADVTGVGHPMYFHRFNLMNLTADVDGHQQISDDLKNSLVFSDNINNWKQGQGFASTNVSSTSATSMGNLVNTRYGPFAGFEIDPMKNFIPYFGSANRSSSDNNIDMWAYKNGYPENMSPSSQSPRLKSLTNVFFEFNMDTYINNDKDNTSLPQTGANLDEYVMVHPDVKMIKSQLSISNGPNAIIFQLKDKPNNSIVKNNQSNYIYNTMMPYYLVKYGTTSGDKGLTKGYKGDNYPAIPRWTKLQFNTDFNRTLIKNSIEGNGDGNLDYGAGITMASNVYEFVTSPDYQKCTYNWTGQGWGLLNIPYIDDKSANADFGSSSYLKKPDVPNITFYEQNHALTGTIINPGTDANTYYKNNIQPVHAKYGGLVTSKIVTAGELNKVASSNRGYKVNFEKLPDPNFTAVYPNQSIYVKNISTDPLNAMGSCAVQLCQNGNCNSVNVDMSYPHALNTNGSIDPSSFFYYTKPKRNLTAAGLTAPRWQKLSQNNIQAGDQITISPINGIYSPQHNLSFTEGSGVNGMASKADAKGNYSGVPACLIFCSQVIAFIDGSKSSLSAADAIACSTVYEICPAVANFAYETARFPHSANDDLMGLGSDIWNNWDAKGVNEVEKLKKNCGTGLAFSVVPNPYLTCQKGYKLKCTNNRINQFVEQSYSSTVNQQDKILQQFCQKKRNDGTNLGLCYNKKVDTSGNNYYSIFRYNQGTITDTGSTMNQIEEVDSSQVWISRDNVSYDNCGFCVPSKYIFKSGTTTYSSLNPTAIANLTLADNITTKAGCVGNSNYKWVQKFTYINTDLTLNLNTLIVSTFNTDIINFISQQGLDISTFVNLSDITSGIQEAQAAYIGNVIGLKKALVQYAMIGDTQTCIANAMSLYQLYWNYMMVDQSGNPLSGINISPTAVTNALSGISSEICATISSQPITTTKNNIIFKQNDYGGVCLDPKDPSSANDTSGQLTSINSKQGSSYFDFVYIDRFDNCPAGGTYVGMEAVKIINPTQNILTNQTCNSSQVQIGSIVSIPEDTQFVVNQQCSGDYYIEVPIDGNGCFNIQPLWMSFYNQAIRGLSPDNTNVNYQSCTSKTYNTNYIHQDFNPNIFTAANFNGISMPGKDPFGNYYMSTGSALVPTSELASSYTGQYVCCDRENPINCETEFKTIGSNNIIPGNVYLNRDCILSNSILPGFTCRGISDGGNNFTSSLTAARTTNRSDVFAMFSQDFDYRCSTVDPSISCPATQTDEGFLDQITISLNPNIISGNYVGVQCPPGNNPKYIQYSPAVITTKDDKTMTIKNDGNPINNQCMVYDTVYYQTANHTGMCTDPKLGAQNTISTYTARATCNSDEISIGTAIDSSRGMSIFVDGSTCPDNTYTLVNINTKYPSGQKVAECLPKASTSNKQICISQSDSNAYNSSPVGCMPQTSCAANQIDDGPVTVNLTSDIIEYFPTTCPSGYVEVGSSNLSQDQIQIPASSTCGSCPSGYPNCTGSYYYQEDLSPKCQSNGNGTSTTAGCIDYQTTQTAPGNYIFDSSYIETTGTYNDENSTCPTGQTSIKNPNTQVNIYPGKYTLECMYGNNNVILAINGTKNILSGDDLDNYNYCGGISYANCGYTQDEMCQIWKYDGVYSRSNGGWFRGLGNGSNICNGHGGYSGRNVYRMNVECFNWTYNCYKSYNRYRDFRVCTRPNGTVQKSCKKVIPTTFRNCRNYNICERPYREDLDCRQLTLGEQRICRSYRNCKRPAKTQVDCRDYITVQKKKCQIEVFDKNLGELTNPQDPTSPVFDIGSNSITIDIPSKINNQTYDYADLMFWIVPPMVDQNSIPISNLSDAYGQFKMQEISDFRNGVQLNFSSTTPLTNGKYLYFYIQPLDGTGAPDPVYDPETFFKGKTHLEIMQNIVPKVYNFQDYIISNGIMEFKMAAPGKVWFIVLDMYSSNANGFNVYPFADGKMIEWVDPNAPQVVSGSNYTAFNSGFYTVSPKVQFNAISDDSVLTSLASASQDFIGQMFTKPIKKILFGPWDANKKDYQWTEGLIYQVSTLLTGNYVVQMLYYLSVVIYLFVMGIQVMLGKKKFDLEMAKSEIWKFALVVTFVSPTSWNLYQAIFVKTAINISEGLVAMATGVFTNSSIMVDGYNANLTDPGFGPISETLKFILNKTTVERLFAIVFSSLTGIITAIIITVAFVKYIITVFKAIFVYIGNLITLSVYLMLGPLAFLALVNDETKDIFEKWFKNILGTIAQQVGLFVGLAIFTILFNNFLKSMLNFTICWEPIIQLPILNLTIFSMWRIAGTYPPQIAMYLGLPDETGNTPNITIIHGIILYMIVQILDKFCDQTVQMAANIFDVEQSAISKGISDNFDAVKNSISAASVTGSVLSGGIEGIKAGTKAVARGAAEGVMNAKGLVQAAGASIQDLQLNNEKETIERERQDQIAKHMAEREALNKEVESMKPEDIEARYKQIERAERKESEKKIENDPNTRYDKYDTGDLFNEDKSTDRENNNQPEPSRELSREEKMAKIKEQMSAGLNKRQYSEFAQLENKRTANATQIGRNNEVMNKGSEDNIFKQAGEKLNNFSAAANNLKDSINNTANMASEFFNPYLGSLQETLNQATGKGNFEEKPKNEEDE